MFQTVDWTIPQLGGLLSQVRTMAPLHCCPRARHPSPGPPVASSKATAAISTSVSSPDAPRQHPHRPLRHHPHHCHRRCLHRRLHHRRHLYHRPLASTSEPWPAASPQVIVKEERQLNEPKPVVTVKHVWNPEDLAGRPNTWNREDGTNKDPMRQKPMEDTDKMSVRPLGRTVVVLAPAKLAAYGSRRPHRVAMEPLRASDRYAGSHRGCAFHSALCV